MADRFLYLTSPYMTGDDVLAWQNALSSIGYDTGPLDGVFGPLTSDATVRFQQDAGVTVDGVVGPETWGAMSAILYPPPPPPQPGPTTPPPAPTPAASAQAYRIEVNPDDTDQRYVLYTSGYVQALGGAPFVVQEAADHSDYFALVGSPGSRPAMIEGGPWMRGLRVTDWDGPGGYQMNVYGRIFPFGTAADIPGGASVPPWPPDLWPNATGADLVVSPDGDGTGYRLTRDGDVQAFGDGVDAVPHAPVNTNVGHVRLQMDWPTKKYVVMDQYGRFTSKNGAPAISVVGRAAGSTFFSDPIAVDFVIVDWFTGDGWMLDAYGRVYRLNDAADPKGFSYTPNAPQWTALGVLSDGTGDDPIRLVTLTATGGLHQWSVSTAPVVTPNVGQPSNPTIDTTRPTVAWSYSDAEDDPQASFVVKVFDEATYASGGEVNEVQELEEVGAPAGGSILATFLGVPSDVIPFDVDDATLEAALEAMSSIGPGNVVCTGGPLDVSPISVEFVNELGAFNQPLISIDASGLTGGVDPNVTVTATTEGSAEFADPALAVAVWQAAGSDRDTRSVVPSIDLPNGRYRAYIRALDTTNLPSEWAIREWVQDTTPPPAPLIAATALGGLLGVSLAVALDAYDLDYLPNNMRVGVMYRDEDTTAWRWVRAAHNLILNDDGEATVIDREARFGIEREYRALSYVQFPWLASEWSASDAATLEPRNVWTLTVPEVAALGGVVRVAAFSPSRTQIAGVFVPAGRRNPIVLTDGAPKNSGLNVEMWALDQAARQLVDDVLDADAGLLLRDPLGRAYYVRPVNDVQWEMIRARPTLSEQSSVRDAHTLSIQFMSIDRPFTGPTGGPLATFETV